MYYNDNFTHVYPRIDGEDLYYSFEREINNNKKLDGENDEVMELLKNHKFSEASEHFKSYRTFLISVNKYLETNPEDNEVLCYKGYVLDSNDQKEEALKCFNEFPEDTDDGRVLTARMHLTYELGRYEDTIKSVDYLLKMFPDNMEDIYFKGKALDKLGRYEEAIECFDEGLQFSPKIVDGHNFSESTIKDMENKKKEIKNKLKEIKRKEAAIKRKELEIKRKLDEKRREEVRIKEAAVKRKELEDKRKESKALYDGYIKSFTKTVIKPKISAEAFLKKEKNK